MECPAEYLEHPTYYRTTQVDGLSISYHETGPKVVPTLLIQGRLLCQTR
jgi:hypothetical protein